MRIDRHALIHGVCNFTFTAMMATFLIAAGCPSTPAQVTAPPPVKIVDQSSCAGACANLQRLGCHEGNPITMHSTCKADMDCKDPFGVFDPHQSCSPSGACTVTCADFCEMTEDHGVWLDPGCVQTIAKCEQISACPLAKAVLSTMVK